jgi:dihydropteroate synthase
MKTEVAEAAIEAGARIVNDVFGLRAPGMAELCAATGVGVVIMHMAGTPRTMQADPHYDDVVLEVAAFLRYRIEDARLAGIHEESIVVDPGIGFGKTPAHNLELLAGLDTLGALGHPVMVGTSRKSFLGTITGRAVDDRDVASAVSAALAAAAGAAVVRVHNVPFGRDAVRVADAMVRRRE